MKETQILRGLHKARAAFASGMVPEERPSVGSRMLGKMTGGMFGAAPPTPNTARAPVAPVQQAPIAVRAVQGAGGGLGNAANALANRKKQLDEAAGFRDGYAPGAETELLTEGSYIDDNNIIQGPGDGTSDSIQANVSANEAILPADTVKAIGPQNLARLIEQTNGESPRRGLSTGYATGFVGETVDKAKQGLNSLKSAFTRTPAAAPPLNSTAAPVGAAAPNVTSRVPTQSVNTVGQDAARAGSRVSGNTAGRVVPPTTPTTGLVRRGLGFAGKALTPLAVAGSAADSYNTPTEDFQAQTGIENELGARTAGVFQNIGNTLTLGMAGKLGEGISNLINGGGGEEVPPQQQSAVTPTLPSPDSTVAQAPAVQPPPAAPTQTFASGARALQLQQAARNGDASINPERGTGFVVANNEGGSGPTATEIDTRPRGLSSGQQTQPAGPYDEQRNLLSRAARADATGTAEGQIESANLRRQADALGKITDSEQTNLTTRSGQRTNQALTDQLRLAADSRAERAADEKSAGEAQKRIAELYPDIGEGTKKIDNSAKRAELTNLIANTVDNLPPEDQAKLFNTASGQARGIEGLDAKARQRLLNNYKVRERVQQATTGLAGIGNQAGLLSDNLMDYDLESATRVGDTIVLKNGAQIQIGDLQFDEGPANPLIPDSWFKTPTSRYTSNLRDAKSTER